ncbi:hypothetical protein Ae201684_015193 [Aphanomyces euteiches]|uniref:Deacetylase sirtuin-type domain-containing protein n=1 Tax=Aphanomyces euteiches TaxID=100861 RepID=A0A6G0WHD7_9STRA|nr:hypothetical protein Ae201684_015193 [Aphanomyces euteiches]KAH9133589.1 hypothetical protein AeRB84_020370 [Aphanomyces euteiches]
MSSNRARYARGVKRQDVNYAVLHTGQLVPDLDSPEKATKKAKKTANTGCYMCQNHQTGDKLCQCTTCVHRFHISCAKKVIPTAPSNQCCQCFIANQVPKSMIERAKVTSLHDMIEIVKHSKQIVVLVGAGISVSCGIPDFRSKNGIYAMVREMDLDLPDPESLFDMDFFRANPKPFFKFATNFFQGKTYEPSLTHRFLRMLQERKQLLRVYSQNIDALEEAAGVDPVIQCHGTLAISACMSCRKETPTADLFQEAKIEIPRCTCGGILKPKITFFGEQLADVTRDSLAYDRMHADLLLVMGTSLQVSPVADIPAFLQGIPQVLVNMQSVKPKKHLVGFDLECLGKCDAIVSYLMAKLDMTSDVTIDEPHFHSPNRYCFESCHFQGSEIIQQPPSPHEDAFHCDGCSEPITKTRFSCSYDIESDAIIGCQTLV